MEELPGLLSALSYQDDFKFLQLVEKEVEEYLSQTSTAEGGLASGDDHGATKQRVPLVFPPMTGHHRYLVHQVRICYDPFGPACTPAERNLTCSGCDLSQVAARYKLHSASTGYGFDRATVVDLPIDGLIRKPVLRLKDFVPVRCAWACWEEAEGYCDLGSMITGWDVSITCKTRCTSADYTLNGGSGYSAGLQAVTDPSVERHASAPITVSSYSTTQHIPTPSSGTHGTHAQGPQDPSGSGADLKREGDGEGDAHPPAREARVQTTASRNDATPQGSELEAGPSRKRR
eukprot:7253136-Pyramimonas_sp.AAC.2